MLERVFISLFFVAIVLKSSLSEPFSYDGFSLFQLKPETATHVRLIQQLHSEQPQFDLWTKIKGIDHHVDVLLAPEHQELYTEIFKAAKIPFNKTVENIQEKIDEQDASMKKRSIGKNIVGTFPRYSEVQSYLDEVVAEHSDIASTYIAGKTYENRELKVLVLKTASTQRSVWFDCGIHAREWISPATCVYMIDKLVTEYKAGVQETVDLMNYYEIHVLPIMNPDGYEYSHTSYRYWRKNRSPNSNSRCVGTDLNRNSGFQWMTGGSSNNPCSDIYAGPSASSELEIKAVQWALNQKLGEWDAYLTFHTYGQWIFTPWGYTYSLPDDYNELYRVANLGKEAIRNTNGNSWVVGSSTNILSIGSGGSEDWAKAVAGIKYSYCFELRPAQSGDSDSFYGFALPASRIPLAGSETYNGVKAMLKSIKNQ